MRIRAILPLMALLLLACLCPATATVPGRKVLQGHTDTVHGVAWSPDGTQLASGSADNTVIVWDVARAKK